jgi:hypothetical protein
MFSLEVKDVLNKLSPRLLNDFIDVMNHELGILIPNRFTPSNDIINDLLRFLQRCRLTGQKCAFCVMNYLFQRIGCFELASEIEFIPYMGYEWASPSSC